MGIDSKAWMIHRRIYNWVLSFSDKKFSGFALFLVAFTESAFFPVPPDVLLISLSVAKPKKSFKYAFLCSAGSVLGALLGYVIGLALYESVGKMIIHGLGYEVAFQKVGMMYAESAFFALLTAAFTIIPFKVFTISAGVWKISIWTLLFASLIGRSLRFFGVSVLFYFFGRKIKDFIEKYFDLLALSFVILLVFGFFLIRTIG